jgi:hypothetical protein
MNRKPNAMYLITPSLLNSWSYQFEVDDEYAEKSRKEFLSYLKREQVEKNEFMIRGIEFEEECIKGNVPVISELIQGGAYQYSGKKEVEVDGVKFLMYGKHDVLKAGIIYDIKRVSKYETQKYFGSYQHHFYFDLVPEADKFVYLINDGSKTFIEEYHRDEKIDLTRVISDFMKWLENNGLFEIYLDHWVAR